MFVNLTVVPGSHGEPIVEVPASLLWDLVEYLSYQRVAVTYHFEQTHFAVTFPHSDLATAQRLLDEWASSVQRHVHA